MVKPTGFMEYPREAPSYRPVEERVRDYKEFVVHLPVARVEVQGARCMDCAVPFCHSLGCPVQNLIPEWNQLVHEGDWREALARLEMTNNLPEITGRVCPAPCESACTLSINTSPVTIKQIELAIVERGFAEGWVVPRAPKRETGKCVAVVGSGPAGLAAAQQLRRAGHQVTLYEKDDKLGGLLRYGIPDFKLEKWVIDRRLEQMRAEGVEFETGVSVGDDISARYLRQRFDAVLLTMGAGQPRDLAVPGRELGGVHFAMEYLSRSNRHVAGDISADELISAKGKVVLVIGGGDTGSDCVGTAHRQGAREVHQFEILPQPKAWSESWNPEWPGWPAILRTSSSQEEGCQRRWSVATSRLTGDGVVQRAHCRAVEWREVDGSRRPVDVPGSEFELDVDLVLLAMGFVHVQHSRLLDDLGVEFDARGNIRTNGDYQTSSPGVFVGGDAFTGASLVVTAIWHGRRAAQAVDRCLCAGSGAGVG
jgi:glutamate synthase (NADPH/NADH) small chain